MGVLTPVEGRNGVRGLNRKKFVGNAIMKTCAKFESNRSISFDKIENRSWRWKNHQKMNNENVHFGNF